MTAVLTPPATEHQSPRTEALETLIRPGSAAEQEAWAMRGFDRALAILAGEVSQKQNGDVIALGELWYRYGPVTTIRFEKNLLGELTPAYEDIGKLAHAIFGRDEATLFRGFIDCDQQDNFKIPPRWELLKEMLVQAGFDATLTKPGNEWDGNDNTFMAAQLNVRLNDNARSIVQRLHRVTS